MLRGPLDFVDAVASLTEILVKDSIWMQEPHNELFSLINKESLGNRVQNLEFLQLWYFSNCYDDWEYEYGADFDFCADKIWSIVIDLKDTVMEGFAFRATEKREALSRWIRYNVEVDRFVATCDANSIDLVLGIFRNWVEGSGLFTPRNIPFDS